MFLTMRALWVMLAGIPLVVLVPRLSVVALWLLALLVLVALDVLAAPSPRLLRVDRRVSRAVRLGEQAICTLTVTNTGRRTARLTVRDAWPPSAGADGGRSRLSIPGGQRRRHRTRLTPWRRGDREAGQVALRSSGPLGIAGRQASLWAPAVLRVLPAFHSRRHLPSRLARLREMDGRSAVMVRGAGTEFDSLREYVVGDDVRSIDWRSSARRGEVVVRTWRPERDRRVLILIDTGRLAAARMVDAPRLDSQIEAALLLAALASHAGDRVDVIALDSAVRAQVHGRSGPALMSALADALAPVEAQLVESDWALMVSLAQSQLSQRSLVVILSGPDGSSGMDPAMLRGLAALARRHTVVLGSATDPGLEELRRDRDDAEAVYLAASADLELADMDAMGQRLRRAGVELVEASDQLLAPALADAYLSLKAAGRL